MYKYNSFVTLTFNNENLPEDGSINKKHLQDFMRKLRRNNDHPIRYFGCGEYGDHKNTFRPHYHVCLFNHKFEDQEILHFDANTKKKGVWQKGHDHTTYISQSLSDLWPYGFHTIGNVTFESAAYVARYVTKKLLGSSPEAMKLKEERYGDKQIEFALMSRMPGLGYAWFQKYHNDLYPKDFIMHNGRRIKPPRYYDTMYQKINPGGFEKIKEKRIENNPQEIECTSENWSREKYRRHLNDQFTRKGL